MDFVEIHIVIKGEGFPYRWQVDDFIVVFVFHFNQAFFRQSDFADSKIEKPFVSALLLISVISEPWESVNSLYVFP